MFRKFICTLIPPGPNPSLHFTQLNWFISHFPTEPHSDFIPLNTPQHSPHNYPSPRIALEPIKNRPRDRGTNARIIANYHPFRDDGHRNYPPNCLLSRERAARFSWLRGLPTGAESRRALVRSAHIRAEYVRLRGHLGASRNAPMIVNERRNSFVHSIILPIMRVVFHLAALRTVFATGRAVLFIILLLCFRIEFMRCSGTCCRFGIIAFISTYNYYVNFMNPILHWEPK